MAGRGIHEQGYNHEKRRQQRLERSVLGRPMVKSGSHPLVEECLDREVLQVH